MGGAAAWADAAPPPLLPLALAPAEGASGPVVFEALPFWSALRRTFMLACCGPHPAVCKVLLLAKML